MPYYFYEYFKKTFFIPYFTCDDISEVQTYQELEQVHTCYCNNDDFHSLPTINFELDAKDSIQYDLNPENYLFLPYINYTTPVNTLCIFAMASY